MFVKTDYTSLVLRPRTHYAGGIWKVSSISTIGLQSTPIRHQNGELFENALQAGGI